MGVWVGGRGHGGAMERGCVGACMYDRANY